tara:strand:- start:16305 stop:16880 length:576 start_codon:yes stop_codon:yes gene_type:complete
MTRLRLGVLIAALAASFASINPDEDLPQADDCTQSSFAVVDEISLVHPDDETVIQDFEVHELIYGPQGGAMVRFRVRASGADAPACMPMTMTYEKCLDEQCTSVDENTGYPNTIALQTYEAGSERLTRAYFAEMRYPLDEGDLARVTIKVGPEEDPDETSVLMWLGSQGTFEDDLRDAGPEDAGPFLDGGF